MYVLTITERAPMPKGRRDTHTYHLFLDTMFDVAQAIEDFEINFGVLVSMTITPFKE